MSETRTFGAAREGCTYVLRPGGYAVVCHNGRVALVDTPTGLHLPGGGQDPGEDAAAAAIREVHEETGLAIRLIREIARADDLVYSPAQRDYFRKRCTFFLAEVADFGSGRGIEPDHRLVWLPPGEAQTSLQQECHRWAIEQARAWLTGEPASA